MITGGIAVFRESKHYVQAQFCEEDSVSNIRRICTSLSSFTDCHWLYSIDRRIAQNSQHTDVGSPTIIRPSSTDTIRETRLLDTCRTFLQRTCSQIEIVKKAHCIPLHKVFHTTYILSIFRTARPQSFRKNGFSACGVILEPCLLPSPASKSTIAECAVTRLSQSTTVLGAHRTLVWRSTPRAMWLLGFRLANVCKWTTVHSLKQLQDRIRLFLLQPDDPPRELPVDEQRLGSSDGMGSNQRVYRLDRFSTDCSSSVTASTVFGLFDAGMDDGEGLEVGAEGG
jgi:hypothetical protein